MRDQSQSTDWGLKRSDRTGAGTASRSRIKVQANVSSGQAIQVPEQQVAAVVKYTRRSSANGKNR